MRIAYLIDSYAGPSAGTERQLQQLVKGMIDCGHEVRLYVLRHTPFTLGTAPFPCPIECLDVRSIASFRTVRKMLALRSALRSEHFAVVHAFFNDAAILAPLFLKARGIRVFTSRRDMGFWYTSAKLLALRAVNWRADAVICNCHAVAYNTASMEHLSLRKIRVIHNAIPKHAVHQSQSASPQIDWRLDKTADMAPVIRICIIANLAAIKRLEDFVLAAATVSQCANCRFLVIGCEREPAYADHLEQLALGAGLDEIHLRFLGQLEDPTEVLKQCDIGVLTSVSEGLSNAILEYLDAGLPVVCSDVGGNRELVEDGVNGFLYPAGNVNALGTALLRLCADEPLREALGRASKVRSRLFSVERMLLDHVDAYSRVR